MLIVKYKGDLYNVDESNSFEDGKIEIFAYEKKEGFSQQKYPKAIISSKRVERSELEALYDIEFYAVWNGERFEFSIQDGIQSIRLWRFTRSTELAEKYNFRMTARDEYEKEVPMKECEHFIMIQRDYDDLNNSAKEVIMQIDEFLPLYRKFVYGM